MKNLIKSYLTFTRTERIGLVGLCALLIILIVVRATMSFGVHPAGISDKNKRLQEAWATFKRSQPVVTNDTTEKTKKEYQDAFDESTAPLPDFININTADSATLVRLKGIGPVTAGKIVARRKIKGVFTNIDQIKETGSFPKATFDVLKRHLSVK